jgi:hypothetical protein
MKRNRMTALLFAGLLTFGVAACDSGESAGPAPAGEVDPALDGGTTTDPLGTPADVAPTE